MADKKKEDNKPSVKTNEFPLKKPYGGKEIGDKVKLGPEGEKFFKSKNRI